MHGRGPRRNHERSEPRVVWPSARRDAASHHRRGWNQDAQRDRSAGKNRHGRRRRHGGLQKPPPVSTGLPADSSPECLSNKSRPSVGPVVSYLIEISCKKRRQSALFLLLAAPERRTPWDRWLAGLTLGTLNSPSF